MNDDSNKASDTQIEESLKEYERKIAEMYAQMQTPKHRQATEAFFMATAEDLNSTYRDPVENADQK